MRENNSKVQVEQTHYDFGLYVNRERWLSYYHQIEEVLKAIEKTNGIGEVLVIGVGDMLVVDILKKNGIKVVTFDFDSSLNPDIVGDVKRIDDISGTNRFSCVMCCQVLEHINGKYFEDIIKRISRICTKTFILSLPSQYKKIEIRLKIRNWEVKRRIMLTKSVLPKYLFNGEHWWELGTRGYELEKITHLVSKYFKLERTYFVDENEYHCFFILQSKLQ